MVQQTSSRFTDAHTRSGRTEHHGTLRARLARQAIDSTARARGQTDWGAEILSRSQGHNVNNVTSKSFAREQQNGCFVQKCPS